jgi:hypothetical protein
VVDGWEPRPDYLLEVLIDNAEALPGIARELREARSHVHLAGSSLPPST